MKVKFLVALLFVGLNFYAYRYFATQEQIPERQPFVAFPSELGDWRCPERETMRPNQERILGVTDYLLCSFTALAPSDPELLAPVTVYVGYHESQVRKEGGSGNETVIHPPEHCLPGAGWNIIDARVVSLDLPGLPGSSGVLSEQREAKRFVIAKGDSRQLVYFWYQSRGRVFARNTDVIVSRMWDRASSGRTDGSLVRFTVPILRGDVDAAEGRFRSLAGELVPLLPSFVPI